VRHKKIKNEDFSAAVISGFTGGVPAVLAFSTTASPEEDQPRPLLLFRGSVVAAGGSTERWTHIYGSRRRRRHGDNIKEGSIDLLLERTR